MTTRSVSDETVALGHRLADAAGAVILPLFRSGHDVENKAAQGFDPVTEADRAAERAMRDLLQRHRPRDGVLGEEFERTPSENGLTWVLDPIDGTRAFISGLPLWGTLIALNAHGRPVLGIVDQPYLGERYWGCNGTAWLRDRQVERIIRTRTCERLAAAVLSTTTPELFNAAERTAFDAVAARARLVRYGCDCYAYAMVAAGLIDVVIESDLKPYDIQGPAALVEAAGGVVTDWSGGPAHDGGQVIAAGDARVHEQALELLRQAAKG